MWTRTQRIRTLSEIDFEFCAFTEPLLKYQEIESKATQLCRLGMSRRQIAQALGVSEKTVKRAIKVNS